LTAPPGTSTRKRSYIALRLARDAVAVPVEAVDVSADDAEVAVSDVGAVQVVVDDRDAGAGVVRVTPAPATAAARAAGVDVGSVGFEDAFVVAGLEGAPISIKADSPSAMAEYLPTKGPPSMARRRRFRSVERF
jgi:hypothetical protein